MQMNPKQRRIMSKKFAETQQRESLEIATGDLAVFSATVVVDPEMRLWFAKAREVLDAARKWYRRNSRNGRRPDAFILFAIPRLVFDVLLFAIEWVYINATSFAWAHALGWVGRDEVIMRDEACAGCSQRFVSNDHSYCHAIQGSCRSCPTKPWWPFSRLLWRARLRNQSCPLGRWDKRRFWAGMARKLGRSKAV